jgi:hypothetical protein
MIVGPFVVFFTVQADGSPAVKVRMVTCPIFVHVFYGKHVLPTIDPSYGSILF